MASASPSPAVCPISLEPIPSGMECDLRGTTFDLRSVLDLVLVQGMAATHPYTRERLGLSDLQAIHTAAACRPTTRAVLEERGFVGWREFVEHCRQVASVNASEMERAMLQTAVQTAWSRILDGTAEIRDVDDIAEIVRFHAALYGESEARRRMIADVADRYAATTCIRELIYLNNLGAILHQVFDVHSYRGSLLGSIMAFLNQPILGDVIERHPPRVYSDSSPARPPSLRSEANLSQHEAEPAHSASAGPLRFARGDSILIGGAADPTYASVAAAAVRGVSEGARSPSAEARTPSLRSGSLHPESLLAPLPRSQASPPGAGATQGAGSGSSEDVQGADDEDEASQEQRAALAVARVLRVFGDLLDVEAPEEEAGPAASEERPSASDAPLSWHATRLLVMDLPTAPARSSEQSRLPLGVVPSGTAPSRPESDRPAARAAMARAAQAAAHSQGSGDSGAARSAQVASPGAAAAAAATPAAIGQVLQRPQTPEHQWAVLIATIVSAAAEGRLSPEAQERGMQRIRDQAPVFLRQLAATRGSASPAPADSGPPSLRSEANLPAATPHSISALRSAHRTLNSAVLMATELHWTRRDVVSMLADVGGVLDANLARLESEVRGETGSGSEACGAQGPV
jgi:hypothetical protein